jgi:DNA modification methylase
MPMSEKLDDALGMLAAAVLDEGPRPDVHREIMRRTRSGPLVTSHSNTSVDLPTPYYEDDAVTIYHGDCRDVLPHLGLETDLLVCDPPYNVGCIYDEHNDRMAPDEYETWCREWWRYCQIATRRQIVFPGHGNLPMWWRLGDIKPSGVGCWYKPGNPASGGVFQHCEWEPYLLFGRARGLPDVIRATVNRQAGVGDHPCPKPLKLYKAILAKSKAESVIDPFMGSGTTLRAAKDLGLPAIGIEISERYCEIAVRRLAQEVLAL